MADIGTAYIRIAPNMTGIQGKIASGFKGAAGPATAALGAEINNNSAPFQSAIGKLGNIAKVGGLAIASGLAVGTAGLIALTTKMLKAGAQLEQQLGGSEAVFGEFAASLQKTAKEAYKQAGLSQNEFLQGANKMGSLFQGAGFTVEKSMNMAAEAMQRASDVASIMGIDTTAALEAVTGMAKGNFTMMDNLGVKMNDTAINAYALEKGLSKTTQQMSEQEKVGLATQLFLEKTAKYAGNYAKENDTLAGSINTTSKAFEDFLSGGGEIENFVDSLLSTIKIAVPKIIKILPKLVDGIGSLLEAVVPAIADVLPTLVPALIKAVLGLMNALVDAFPTIVKVLVDAMPVMIEGFVKLFLAILQALPKIIKIISAAIPTIVDAIVVSLTSPEALTAIILGAIELMLAILDALPIVINALVKALPTIIDNIVKTMTSPENMKKSSEIGVRLVRSIISGIWSILGELFNAGVEMWLQIANVLSWDSMSRIGRDMISGLWSGISSLAGWIFDKLSRFGYDIIQILKDIFGIHSPSTVFAGIGVNLNKGLAQGLDSSAGLVAKSMDAIANDALFAMSSPLLSADVAFGSTTPGMPAAGSPNNVSNQTVSIQKVVLADESAVRAFFNELNQDTISVAMGITPRQGAMA